MQTDSREEVSRAEVFQIDLGPLHGIGAFVQAPGFNIKVLHQGQATKKGLASGRLRKELGDATKGLKDTSIAYTPST